MDREAALAIKKAFELPLPHNSTTIPDRAIKTLADKERGPERIYAEIDAMVDRNELAAPTEPWKDWQLGPGT